MAALYEAAAARMPHVVSVSVTDVLCDVSGHCPAKVGGVLARFDGVHYTSEFSRRIVPIIVDRARRAGVSFAPRLSSSAPATAGRPRVTR
jgi:hypothetical protein